MGIEKNIFVKYYNPNETQLKKKWIETQEKLNIFNNLGYSDRAKRLQLLKSILGKSGRKCSIYSPFYCDYGSNIIVGENFFANYNCTILDADMVHIGNNVMIGPNTSIITVSHPISKNLRNSGYCNCGSITIGDDVWIGANVVILPGVKIGANTVIGAGTIVTKNLPSNVVVVGNPCEIVHTITDYI